MIMGSKLRLWAPVGAAVVVGLFIMSRENYLLYHTLVELLSVVVFFSVFTVGWSSRHLEGTKPLTILACAYLTVGAIDLMHALSYKGMAIFSHTSANLPTQMWIVARYVESLSLLLAVYMTEKNRTYNATVLLGSYLAVLAVSLFTVFGGIFPVCYIEGAGLTTFKIVGEYILIGILLATVVHIWRRRHDQDRTVTSLFAAAVLTTAVSELAFTAYVDVFGFFNFLGHVFKLVSSVLIYLALVKEAFRKPYSTLLRSLVQSQNDLQLELRAHRAAEEEIRYLSFHDRLTGLFNRAFAEEELQRLDCTRQLPISIVIGDVNGLKLTNDGFGHDVGDELLVQIAGALRQSCRSEDIVARWGGDEFIVLLPQTSTKAAGQIMQRIKAACAQAEGVGPVSLSISLGSATKTTPDEDIHEIIGRAEDDMYRNKLTETRSFRSSLIASLQKALQEKNLETKDHTTRVEALSRAIAKQLGLPEAQLSELSLLAALHDIGKIAVPEYLLTKPRPLAGDEREIVQEHAEIGYRIISACPDLASVADDILAHHERWDGQGYPRQLAKKQIPLLARIVAVADRYDVMTHDQPNRKALEHKAAMDEIRKQAGHRFDPDIVNAFVAIWDSNKDNPELHAQGAASAQLTELAE